jgi:hypothetical protein
MPKIKFENLKFEQIMKDYATIRETTIPDAVHLNARLLCAEFARRTQAFGKDEKVGTERVRKDITNIIKPPVYFLQFLGKTQSERLKKNLTKNFQARNWTGLKSTLAAVGMGSEAFTVVESGDYAGIHRENRNPKTGRTFKRPQKFYLGADSTSLFNYIKERQQKVGLAKAGWAECALKLKKVISRSQTYDFEKWWLRNKPGTGSVQDNTSNVSAPTVTLTNSLPWADSVLRLTEQLNGMAFVAQKMKKQMEIILKKRQLKLSGGLFP